MVLVGNSINNNNRKQQQQRNNKTTAVSIPIKDFVFCIGIVGVIVCFLASILFSLYVIVNTDHDEDVNNPNTGLSAGSGGGPGPGPGAVVLNRFDNMVHVVDNTAEKDKDADEEDEDDDRFIDLLDGNANKKNDDDDDDDKNVVQVQEEEEDDDNDRRGVDPDADDKEKNDAANKNTTSIDNYDEKESFGACLMIMDDNHFLVEWLAYHYYVLPLRHLTVYIDENSHTSPVPILDRWKNYITIDILNNHPNHNNNNNLSKNGTIGQVYSHDLNDMTMLAPVAPYLMKYPRIRNYLARQNKFYEDCIKQYKLRNWKSWILLTDTDEFISINVTTTTANTTTAVANNSNSIPSPTKDDEGSVRRMLKIVAPQQSQFGVDDDVHVMEQDGQEEMVDPPPVDCINTRRTQICCRETMNDTSTSSSSSSSANKLLLSSVGLQRDDLLTYKWTLSDGLMGWRTPKAMIYIPNIENKYLFGEDTDFDLVHRGSAHRLLPDKGCPTQQYFQIYHYHGSEEQYTFKDKYHNDPRGSFLKRAGGSRLLGYSTCQKIKANDLQSWLHGFVYNSIGGNVKEARRLLQDAGRVAV